MIDAKAAEALAANRPGAVIFNIEEFPWGWVFFYESRKFLETSSSSCCRTARPST